VQFLVHHGGQPGVAVGGDGVDHLVQQVPREAFGGVDVADLGPLGFRSGVDLGRLPGLFGGVVVALGERGGPPDRAHGDRLGDRRGEPGGQQHHPGAAAGDDAEDDAEDVDQAVLAAEDHITQPVGLAVGFAMLAPAGGGAGAARDAHGAAQPGQRPRGSAVPAALLACHHTVLAQAVGTGNARAERRCGARRR